MNLLIKYTSTPPKNKKKIIFQKKEMAEHGLAQTNEGDVDTVFQCKSYPFFLLIILSFCINNIISYKYYEKINLY